MTLKLSEIHRRKAVRGDVASMVEHHFEVDHPYVFGDLDLAALGKNYAAWRKIWTESLKRSH
jgi:hypothetical protein